jgi:quinoprotein glucose dehydrogenase
MQLFSGSRPILKITGVIYALIGLALAGAGVWLAAVGGVLILCRRRLGILITGVL